MDAPFDACPLAVRRAASNPHLRSEDARNIKTMAVNQSPVDSNPDLRQAWEALRSHWHIEPTSEQLPSTPAYTALRLFLSPLLRPLLRWRIRGAERIPRHGPTILAANHLSHIDPIAVIAAARRTTHYLAKDGHFSNPATRLVMQATGQIETQREQGGNEALASAATILSQGRALGIFPEGTRSKRTEPPFLLPGKTGVARLAAAHPDAVVVPIALLGTRGIMQPQKDKFPKLWRRFEVSAGVGITWYSWLGHPQGGAMKQEDLEHLAGQEEHEIRKVLAGLYRSFMSRIGNVLRNI